MLSSTKRTRLSKFTPMEDMAEVVHHQLGCMQAVYDYSVDGGAVGTIGLKDVFGNKALLPSGALIKKVIIHVEAALTSGGLATISVGSEAAGDLKGATAVASYSLAANLDGIPDGAAANIVRLTAERQISIAVAVAALTAGKMHVFIDYVVRS